MAKLLVYRCPQNGLMTQTWLADEVVGGDRPTYEPVFCLACSQQHFISLDTGRALGDTSATVTATHGPAFPPREERFAQRAALQQEPTGFGSPDMDPFHGNQFKAY
ncbi:hypothetical protein I8G32_01853 [Rhodopseudomonas palustris]|uniref:Uncharacterized protein n=2 Tax=Rhodopseudomonas palustris (strain ATCC BAA-98 / CGA009) TaxID=258594 RepID=Q6N8U4_RHOPA|nr:hypothetical protein B1S06_09630 [Rhodopseudomonas palustris]CAE27250.1 hypothetical protein RPA1809 [Rhodopseudomonas palustris CGA009]PPQ43584.1 hypothetical protein CKO39_10295 [Rhodopseudomonas palustris]QLH70894.1 hypothetical protein HZF03_08920 [Rhodopseudomonas palustris]QQM03312.1 hypothetical protein I8G32_01853 [Rhodopseudomonas palustris]